jgi:hypothetical protein
MSEDLVTRADLDAALRQALESIDEVHENMAAFLDAFDKRAPDQNRWCWRSAAGEDRHLMWVQLGEWVAWFNTRYGTAGGKVTIPPCWPAHPVAVEELTGLMLAWTGAYAADAPPDAVLSWHDRWLWPCLDRLHTKPGTFEHCTMTKHELRHTVEVSPTAHRAALEQAIAADLEAAALDEEAPA